MAPAQASLLAKLDTQERVRDFLTNAVASGRASHAYLFLGAPGAGKLDAAWALAQAFLCEQDGCGACDSCVRVSRHTHPDVHYYTPESATGYLIAQTRELLDDVPLAPIRAKAKVYIIDRAEQLRANTANALLKTLEEPPEGVMFILLGTSAAAGLCPRALGRHCSLRAASVFRPCCALPASLPSRVWSLTCAWALALRPRPWASMISARWAPRLTCAPTTARWVHTVFALTRQPSCLARAATTTWPAAAPPS